MLLSDKDSFSPQIFIGGCARSGTRLLGSILGTAPQTLCLPETPFIAPLITDKAPLDAADIERLIDRIAGHPAFQPWGAEVTPARFLNLAGRRDYAGLIDALAADYGRAIGHTEIRRWVHPSPRNIQHGRQLAAAFPRAKFIHIYRDGRAVANALLPLDWGPHDIIGMANYWRDSLSVGFGLSTALPPDRLLQVKYEELIRHPATAMRRIAAFLGLDYAAVPLGPRGPRAPADKRPAPALDNATPDRINAWRDRLSPREIEVFEYLAGGLLAHLGYALVAGRKPRAPSPPERLRWRLRDAYRRRIHGHGAADGVDDFSQVRSA